MEKTGKNAFPYDSVQFVGLCISSTPGNLESIEETSDNGCYLGELDTGRDINRRISFLKKVIDYTEQLEYTVKQNNTLKIFVIPEFFFRGSQGAYQISQEPYTAFKTLFSDLLSYIADERFKDWLFVFGTVVSTQTPIDTTDPYYRSGDNLLDVYHRLHGAGSEQKPESLRVMLKTLDMNQTSEDTPFQDVLKNALSYCDTTAKIVIDNSCFVVPGGNSTDPFRILKKYKSKEDFVLNSSYNGQPTGYLQSITKYADIPGDDEIKKRNDDEYAMFQYRGIRFGLEICLDHSRQRLVQHVQHHPEDLVDIQIISSCGMAIKENAVAAKPTGFVFNCDGEYELQPDCKGKIQGINGDRSHTSLRRVKMIKLPKNASSDNDSFAELTDPISPIFNMRISWPDTKDIFPQQYFNVHVYPARSLNAMEPPT